MQSTSASCSAPKFRRTAALAALVLAFTASPTLADCGADASEVDARCYNGNLQAAVSEALASDRPLLLPHGTYSLSAPLVIDYATRADSGFRVVSQGARIDGTTIHDGSVFEIICSGGSTANPKGCFYFHEEGSLFIDADTPDYAVRFGLDDFSDAHNSAKLDHLIVNNRYQTRRGGGAVRLNYVLNSDLFVVADTAGQGGTSGEGGAGLVLKQVQFSHIKGAASATAGTALLIENGYTMSNTIEAMDLEASEVCLGISSSYANHNTFVSPYFNCREGVIGLAGRSNVLFNALWAGEVEIPIVQGTGITVSP
jgi:hypothetical protein